MGIPLPVTPRKGARRMADIPPDVLARLNRGEEPSITLAEILALDFAVLLRHAAPRLTSGAIEAVAGAGGIIARMAAAGAALHEHFGPRGLKLFEKHPSDTVRGWAAYAIGADPKPALEARLKRIRALADDPHSGVREWAWIALRPHIARDPERAIALLIPWTRERSANLRRYASEITRPRGVWCGHIEALKRNPAPGLPILEPLRADTTKYVQDSVSNWLNDAAKSKPAWVKGICARWRKESESKHTERICKRALRSVSP